jgi:hypothetical protein
VCKRWERLFSSEPAVWRHYKLRPFSHPFPQAADEASKRQAWGSWCAAKHRQLAHIAGFVESFEAGPTTVDYGKMGISAHASGWRLAQFVSLLHPEVLTEVALNWGMVDLTELLRFPRLTRLLLHSSTRGGGLGTGLPRLLGGLPQLRSLGLHVDKVSGEEMAAILGLRQLTQLSFAVFRALRDGAYHQLPESPQAQQLGLLQLTRLAQMRHLSISHHRQGVLPLPLPASFAALEFYHISIGLHAWPFNVIVVVGRQGGRVAVRV